MKKLIISSKFLQDCKSISYDDSNDVYLVNSEVMMHNIDECIRQMNATTHSAYERLTTADAFHIDDKKAYFIEFKNQEPRDIKKSQLKNKYIATRAALANFVNGMEIEYIVVTKSVSNYKNRTRKIKRTMGCLKYIDNNCEISILAPVEFDKRFV